MVPLEPGGKEERRKQLDVIYRKSDEIIFGPVIVVIDILEYCPCVADDASTGPHETIDVKKQLSPVFSQERGCKDGFAERIGPVGYGVIIGEVESQSKVDVEVSRGYIETLRPEVRGQVPYRQGGRLILGPWQG